MIDARIKIDDRKIERRLRELEMLFTRGGAVPILREIGRYGKTSTQLRFRTQLAPDGSRWPPSRRAREEGGQTGRDSSRMLNSITVRVDRQGVAWGTNPVYAPAFHYGKTGIEQVAAHTRRQTVVFGRRLQKPIRVQVAAHRRKANQAARPLFGLSPRDRSEILGILKEGLRRRGAR